jgi:hypothetical protein
MVLVFRGTVTCVKLEYPRKTHTSIVITLDGIFNQVNAEQPPRRERRLSPRSIESLP